MVLLKMLVKYCGAIFREIQNTVVGQTGWLFSPIHPWFRHACGNQRSWCKDHPVPSVRLRWPFHLHVPHTRRASNLPPLQLHQDGSVYGGKTESPLGHSGWWTHQQLPRDRSQRQTVRAAAEGPTTSGPGGTDPERAELPALPWGAFPYDEREHEPASSVVVYRSDLHPHHHRHLADETPQELLWGQKAGVRIRQRYRDNNSSNIH